MLLSTLMLPSDTVKLTPARVRRGSRSPFLLRMLCSCLEPVIEDGRMDSFVDNMVGRVAGLASVSVEVTSIASARAAASEEEISRAEEPVGKAVPSSGICK